MGAGASISLTNAVSGATTGSLNLTQQAMGGSGGNILSGTGLAGAGGNAASVLSVNDLSVSYLNGSTYAYGGAAGGSVASGVLGAAGLATATTALIGAQYVSSSASVVGGSGGSVFDLGTAGAGGNVGTVLASGSALTVVMFRPLFPRQEAAVDLLRTLALPATARTSALLTR